MQCRHVAYPEQRRIAAQRLSGPGGGDCGAYSVADDQYFSTRIGRRPCHDGDTLRCVQPRLSGDPHGLARCGLVDRQHLGVACLRPAVGGVSEPLCFGQAPLFCAQQPRLCTRSERGGQQHGMSARLQMAAQQVGQQRLHEPIRGMHLIYYQQMPQQGGTPQMGMAGGDAGQQHLINGADGDLRR